jgi:cutinase
MHGAVSSLDQATLSRVVGGALFGDSMNGRHKGKIPNYPAENIKELCNSGDGICSPTIQGITAAHLAYGSDGSAAKAADFLAGKVRGR